MTDIIHLLPYLNIDLVINITGFLFSGCSHNSRRCERRTSSPGCSPRSASGPCSGPSSLRRGPIRYLILGSCREPRCCYSSNRPRSSRRPRSACRRRSSAYRRPCRSRVCGPLLLISLLLINEFGVISLPSDLLNFEL